MNRILSWWHVSTPENLLHLSIPPPISHLFHVSSLNRLPTQLSHLQAFVSTSLTCNWWIINKGFEIYSLVIKSLCVCYCDTYSCVAFHFSSNSTSFLCLLLNSCSISATLVFKTKSLALTCLGNNPSRSITFSLEVF